MIKVLEVSRDGMKRRYEIQYVDGNVTWFQDLYDTTYNNPELFSSWLKNTIEGLLKMEALNIERK